MKFSLLSERRKETRKHICIYEAGTTEFLVYYHYCIQSPLSLNFLVSLHPIRCLHAQQSVVELQVSLTENLSEIRSSYISVFLFQPPDVEPTCELHIQLKEGKFQFVFTKFRICTLFLIVFMVLTVWLRQQPSCSSHYDFNKWP